MMKLSAFHAKKRFKTFFFTILAYAEYISGQCQAPKMIKLLENHKNKMFASLPNLAKAKCHMNFMLNTHFQRHRNTFLVKEISSIIL